MREGARARALLGLGAAVGLAVAAWSLLTSGAQGVLPPGAVARVGERVIRTDELSRLLAALAGDRRTRLTEADRERLLDRLIEEELLVQHGLALGLARSDRRVRADLVSAVLDSITAAADAVEPGPRELAEFYSANGDYFARPERVWVRSVFVAGDGPEALERAAEAARRLRAGEPVDRVRAELGDPPLAPLPDAPLPPAKLREYLGPRAVEAARALAPGEVSEALLTPQGSHVLQLVEREAARVPALEDVEPLVRAELKRRAADSLLRERLDELRARADVSVSRDLPALP